MLFSVVKLCLLNIFVYFFEKKGKKLKNIEFIGLFNAKFIQKKLIIFMF